jgi:hypothetical protein
MENNKSANRLELDPGRSWKRARPETAPGDFRPVAYMNEILNSRLAPRFYNTQKFNSVSYHRDNTAPKELSEHEERWTHRESRVQAYKTVVWKEIRRILWRILENRFWIYELNRLQIRSNGGLIWSSASYWVCRLPSVSQRTCCIRVAHDAYEMKAHYG